MIRGTKRKTTDNFNPLIVVNDARKFAELYSLIWSWSTHCSNSLPTLWELAEEIPVPGSQRLFSIYHPGLVGKGILDHSGPQERKSFVALWVETRILFGKKRFIHDSLRQMLDCIGININLPKKKLGSLETLYGALKDTSKPSGRKIELLRQVYDLSISRFDVALDKIVLRNRDNSLFNRALFAQVLYYPERAYFMNKYHIITSLAGFVTSDIFLLFIQSSKPGEDSNLTSYIPQNLIHNSEVLLALAKKKLLSSVDQAFFENNILPFRTLIKQLLVFEPKLFIRLNETLRNDEEIFGVALKKDISLIEYISAENRHDFIDEAVKIDGSLIRFADNNQKKNKALIYSSLKQSGLNLQYILPSFIDLGIAAFAVNENVEAIAFVPDEIDSPKQLVQLAFNKVFKNSTADTLDENLSILKNKISNVLLYRALN